MSKTRIIDAVKRLDLEETRRQLAADPALLMVKNDQGRNLLHLACGASCEKLKVPETVGARMVKFLLDRGLDLEEEGLSGRDPCKPIWFAVAFGRNPTVVKLLDILLRAGAPIDVVEEGGTPFLASWCWRRFAAAKFLALRGANVNYQDAKGKTALHHGVEKEFEPALLRWLVRRGASADIEDREGVSPRVRASRKRDKRFLEALE